MSRPRRSIIAPTKANESKYKDVLFVREVPETTKIPFKAACAQTNKTMRDVIILLMRKYSAAVEKKKPTIRIDDIYRLAAEDKI